MAEGRKTGGRKKGTPNLKTKEKARAVAGASVAVAAAMAAPGSIPFNAEITPKEVMLNKMRKAYHESEVAEVRAVLAHEIAQAEMEQAKSMTPADGEDPAAFRERKTLALETAKKALETAALARMAETSATALALQCAKDAAPYEHPRQQAVTVGGDLNLTIVRQKFERPPKPAHLGK
jgi:hypothetical protein